MIGPRFERVVYSVVVLLQSLETEAVMRATYRISMRVRTRTLIVVVLLSTIAACSSSHPQPPPILKGSDRPLSLGDPPVEQDLRNCRAEVREAAFSLDGFHPLGVTANGIVLGSVDIPHPVWPSRQAYRHAIERCLTARGYVFTASSRPCRKPSILFSFKRA